MPALFPSRTWVYVHALYFFIINNLQDMRMTANKQLRRVGIYFSFDERAVFIGVAANVRNPHVNPLTNETQVFRVNLSYISTVDISENPF